MKNEPLYNFRCEESDPLIVKGMSIETFIIKYDQDLIFQLNILSARVLSFIIHRSVDKGVDKHVHKRHNPYGDSFFSELPEN